MTTGPPLAAITADQGCPLCLAPRAVILFGLPRPLGVVRGLRKGKGSVVNESTGAMVVGACRQKAEGRGRGAGEGC